MKPDNDVQRLIVIITQGVYCTLHTFVRTFSLQAFRFRAISKADFKNTREAEAAIPLARIQISTYNKLVII